MAAIGLAGSTRLGKDGSLGASRPGSVQLLAPSDAAAIGDEWRALAAHAVEDNHFFLPDVVLAAAEEFAPNVRVLAVRGAAGRLIGLAPALSTRLGRIAPALRIWSHSFGPFGVPLVADGDLDHASSLLVQAAATLIFPDLPVDGPVARALQRAAERAGRAVDIVDAHERAALLRTSAAGDLRAALPTRRRKEFARQMRRLADLGPVTIESATGPQEVTARVRGVPGARSSRVEGAGRHGDPVEPGRRCFRARGRAEPRRRGRGARRPPPPRRQADCRGRQLPRRRERLDLEDRLRRGLRALLARCPAHAGAAEPPLRRRHGRADKLQECWSHLKDQEQKNIHTLKALIAEEIKQGCF